MAAGLPNLYRLCSDEISVLLRQHSWEGKGGSELYGRIAAVQGEMLGQRQQWLLGIYSGAGSLMDSSFATPSKQHRLDDI